MECIYENVKQVVAGKVQALGSVQADPSLTYVHTPLNLCNQKEMF